jgi:fructokinase
MTVSRAAIAVIGEALLDVVELGDDEPRLARPGGSPYNVALGLARLGQSVSFVGRLSRDPLGTILRSHAQRSGVDLSLALDTDDPTTVALVELDGTGSAQYRFGVTGTADFRWTHEELARLPSGLGAVHFGSLASWLPPGAAAITGRIAALRAGGALITYDPNVRPLLQPDRAGARAAVEAAVALAHLVKTSEEDLDWVRPGEPIEDVAADWLARGPAAVVVTRGGAGSITVTSAGVLARPAVPVRIVDTVGAGDAFMSGLLDSLARRGLLTPGEIVTAPYADVLDDAALIAAITCSRAGANPPHREDLASFRA